MNRRALLAVATAALLGMAASGPAAAEEKPSGTITIKSTSIALGIGVTWGEGTLTFEGETYDFKVSGLSIVDLGMSSITATGHVYRLLELSDFPGNYVSGQAGAAVIKGYSALMMENQSGVLIKLTAKESGAKLTLAAQGMKIEFAD